MQRLAVVGGGPAGLMAAEVASQAGAQVDVYESRGSVGRKFLIAGKGGLNLTHSEAPTEFAARYGARRDVIAGWLKSFDAAAVREWARGLGVDTFVGTSGRIFPVDFKAAPLLRSWVHRLRDQGVRFHVKHRCVGIDGHELQFETPRGTLSIEAGAIVLALGGGSWPQLGSDGAWVEWLRARDVDIAPLESSNCGFDVEWTPTFVERFAGQPVKSVVLSFDSEVLQSEFVVTTTGVEGTGIYALSAKLREALRHGSATLHLDLAPEFELSQLESELAQARGRRTFSEHLRRRAHMSGVKAGLLYEVLSKEDHSDAAKVAATIKALPLRVLRPRPLEEAISTAGGVRFEALQPNLMLKNLPGVFCVGEMLDWEAPTGGYLLTGCLASGRVAGWGAVEWLRSQAFRSLPT